GVGEVLERDPPYGGQVSFSAGSGAATGGWNAPTFAPWLEEAITQASRAVFGREAVNIGCGGTIPFMGMLGERFPKTQFFITGVLGPHANAHRPNEFLHLDYARRLTACVYRVLAEHARTLTRRRISAMKLGLTAPLRRCQPSRNCAALSAGASKSTAAKSARSASSISVHFGSPLGNLPRRVNTMRPSTGT